MKKWLLANAPLLEAFLAHLDTPVALSVLIELRYRAWDNLALRWCDPRNYPEGIFSALRYAKDVQAVDLLRKAPLPTTFNRKDAALATWDQCETQCALTNEFIESLRWPGIPKDSLKARYSEFLGVVKKRMARWLGPLPVELEGGFGPGTCVEYEGADPTVVDKIWLTPTTTPAAADLFSWHYSRTLWGQVRWADRLGAPGISRGNRLTTVPKDGKIDRPISIEPLGNLWLQLGIGRYLKRRLEFIGLPAFSPVSRELFPGYEYKSADAQTVHRDLLRRCSSEFSTIDLSSASDTIALELVREVLPPDWFSLLDCCRSKFSSVPSDGGPRWRLLEKFSSMGNGFTFELETFVFTSLLSVAFGLTPGIDLWVFGDDIILPKRYFDSACNLLSVFGFTPNLRKSYKDGPFYESCGGNLHSGIDVTPLRLKGPLEDVAELYAFHNACARRGFPRKVLRLIRNLIPKPLQFPGPEQLGDVVLHRLPYRSVSAPEKSGAGCRWVRTLRLKPQVQIPLEMWSEELSVVALLLGSSTRVVRRRVRMLPSSTLASIS